MSDTTEELQKLNMGRELELFDLDCSSLGAGGPTLHFTPSVESGGSVQYDATTSYAPAPIEAEGFDRGTTGALPQPVLRVSSAPTLLLPTYIDTYDDLLGAVLTRTLIFERFLHGEVDADPDAYHRRDVFYVEQKTRQNPVMIEFRLASPFDQEGRKLPRRMMLKRICPRRYREWVSGTTFTNFDTTETGGCPYTGSDYFKADNSTTETASEDRCGKTLASCRLRFTTGALPFGAFPGVAADR